MAAAEVYSKISWSNVISPASRISMMSLASCRLLMPAASISAAEPKRCAEVFEPPTARFTASLLKQDNTWMLTSRPYFLPSQARIFSKRSAVLRMLANSCSFGLFSSPSRLPVALLVSSR